MEIEVNANFKLTGIFDPPTRVFLDGKNITLKKLLERLDAMWDSVHILRDGDLSDDIEELCVNGRRHFFLPNRLETPLKNKDEVWIELYMAPLGGG